MTNTRRKNRWRTKRERNLRQHAAGLHRVLTGRTPSPFALSSYEQCQPADWTPDLDNAHLFNAAAGRLTIGDPAHRPPAPINFAPPGRRAAC